MTTPADELKAAAGALQADPHGRETVLPSGAVISRTIAEPLANLLDLVASDALDSDHEHLEGPLWCSAETCAVSAALAVARAINGGEPR